MCEQPTRFLEVEVGKPRAGIIGGDGRKEFLDCCTMLHTVTPLPGRE